MAEKDLPSNSDESDEDFVPEGKPSSDEDSVSGESEENSDDDAGPKTSKRRKVTRRKKKSKEVDKASEDTEEKPEKTTDVDALWADFKQDVTKMEKQITSTTQDKLENKQNSDYKQDKPGEGNSNSSKTLIDNKRNFSSMMNSGSKLGLNKILSQIKKTKMSTLAKSRCDWDNFKKSEGIEEEIKLHNKGKDGYLEKQDFLQRTDLRQFEIEKQLRASRRHF